MNIQEFAMTVEPDTQVVLHTKTLVKMNKKDVETKTIVNPYEKIYKISSVLVTLNSNYEKRVNDERSAEDKDADFKAQEMKYGKMVGNALLENKDQLYIKCIEEEKIGKSKYFTDTDEEISYSEFEKFIPVKKSSGSQNLGNEVKVRNFKIESIIGFEVK
jgi:hypothetical protein